MPVSRSIRARASREARLRAVDVMLQKRGHGQRCMAHKRRMATLGILWADGRGVWYSCGRECLAAWEKKTGRWACIVRVTPLVSVT